MFTAYGSFSHQDILLVRIFTRDSLTGIGEVPAGGTLNYGGFNPESVGADILNTYAKRIVGKEFERALDLIGLLDKPISRSQEEREISSRAPLDLALYDLQGKIESAPVSDILGRIIRGGLEVGYIASSETPEGLVEEVQENFKRGFKSFKIKLTGDRARDKLIVEMVRSNFGDKITVWADANEQWTPEEAIDWCRSLGSSSVDYMEQPVPGWDVEGLAKVRSETKPTKIIADQAVFSVYDAEKILRSRAADVLTLKAMRLGITNAVRVAKLAREHGIDCKVGAGGEGAVGGAAMIHHAMVVTNLADCNELSFPRYSNLPFDGLLPIDRNGAIWTVKRSPGLGVEPREELVERPIGAVSE